MQQHFLRTSFYCGSLCTMLESSSLARTDVRHLCAELYDQHLLPVVRISHKQDAESDTIVKSCAIVCSYIIFVLVAVHILFVFCILAKSETSFSFFLFVFPKIVHSAFGNNCHVLPIRCNLCAHNNVLVLLSVVVIKLLIKKELQQIIKQAVERRARLLHQCQLLSLLCRTVR